jgi:hypothetical protein
MKKLVLAMVFVLLMALFIAFNYLLWERQSREAELKTLEYNNASNNASINAQSREIKSLEDENSKLKSTISDMENEQKNILQSKNLITAEKEQLNLTMANKIEVINALKQNTDIKFFEVPVKKWADAVNAGKYNEAYELEQAGLSTQNKPVSILDYTHYLSDTVKNITIKSVKLVPEEGNVNGEIYLAVSLEVKLVENSDSSISRFVNGLNEMYFILDYNVTNKEFIIKEITKAPLE